MIMMWTGALKKKFFYILFLLINYLNLSQPSEMTLKEVAPGVSPEDVKNATGSKYTVSPDLCEFQI